MDARCEQPVRAALKRRMVLCSFEAAALSILIHLLLLIFAGTTVFMSVAIKDSVWFKGEKVKRTQLEKRAEIPVLIKQMSRKGPRPLMVKQVVRPAANRVRIPVPPPTDIGFNLTGMTLNRESFSKISMPGRLDIGVSKINFFGTRAKGEKIIFILDASKQMMEDSKGGYATYKYAKDEVHQLVNSMPSATLINVMVYSGSNLDMFKPQVVPATPGNRAALKEWLEPINSDPYNVGRVSRNYRSETEYDSLLDGRVQYWLQAAQAAMEQRADSIFVLCGGMGRYTLPGEGGGGGSGLDPEEMAEYRAKREVVDEKARRMLEKENVARKKRGLPPKIIYSWYNYVTDDLRLEYPTPPSRQRRGSGFVPTPPEELVLDHMEEVCIRQYSPYELKNPAVNFVYLMARDGVAYKEYQSVTGLREIAREYRGDFKFIYGAKTMHNLTY